MHASSEVPSGFYFEASLFCEKLGLFFVSRHAPSSALWTPISYDVGVVLSSPMQGYGATSSLKGKVAAGYAVVTTSM